MAHRITHTPLAELDRLARLSDRAQRAIGELLDRQGYPQGQPSDPTTGKVAKDE